MAERLDRKIMVRLVKGAYWDAEIKRAQVEGIDGFPVFTHKAHTDISYIANARKLLGMTDRIYPQFATHNAHTVAAILHMAQTHAADYEFQRLHGMGETLHKIVLKRNQPAAGSTPRLAPIETCWPTWCGACLKTARTPALSTRSSMKACPQKSWPPIPLRRHRQLSPAHRA